MFGSYRLPGRRLSNVNKVNLSADLSEMIGGEGGEHESHNYEFPGAGLAAIPEQRNFLSEIVIDLLGNKETQQHNAEDKSGSSRLLLTFKKKLLYTDLLHRI